MPFIFFDILYGLLFDFPVLLGAGPYLIMGLIFLWPTSWLPSFPTILFCYSCYNDSILLGLFRPAVYSFPQWLGMAIGFPIYGLLCPFCLSLGHPWPTCFLWASLALLLTMHFHGLLLTSLGFPGPITLFSSLGFMGLPLTPYFLCLYYFGPVAALSYFSTSYTAHGYAISLFPGFFKPTCQFFAALVVGLFFFLLGFSQMTLNKVYRGKFNARPKSL